MRQRLLDKQYALLKEELGIREEARWLQSLIQELRQRLQQKQDESHQLHKKRLVVERKLCRPTMCPSKDEPNHRRTKQEKGNDDLEKKIKNLSPENLDKLLKELSDKAEKMEGGDGTVSDIQYL